MLNLFYAFLMHFDLFGLWLGLFIKCVIIPYSGLNLLIALPSFIKLKRR